MEEHNPRWLAAVCSAAIFTHRYNDKEIKLINVTLMWQQIIHDSIRSHFHSTTQRHRIPWSMAVNGSLHQLLWLITHSNTTVPRVVHFPSGHWFTDQRLTVLHLTCFSICRAQMLSFFLMQAKYFGIKKQEILWWYFYLQLRKNDVYSSMDLLDSSWRSKQLPLSFTFIIQLVPWSLIVIPREFSIGEDAKFSRWTFYPPLTRAGNILKP